MVQPNNSPSNSPSEERRQFPGLVVPAGIPIKAEVETIDRILRSCKCVNIGPQGALLDFGEGRCPNLPVESKLFVTIKLAGEVARLPGLVRHRYEDRLGIFFSTEGDPHFEDQEKVLGLILRTLERGIQRRKGR